MSLLTLRLFGTPAVLHGEMPLSFRTRKTLSLLLYLAVEDAPRARAHLSAFFWPEHDATRARALLRRTLAFLRETLAEPDGGEHLVVTADSLAVARNAALTTDLEPLYAALACLDASADPAALVGALEAAVDAYRGEFLEGFAAGAAPAFEDWAARHRARWLQAMERIFARLVTLHAAAGEHRRAIDVASRWAVCSPLDERAYVRLMECHAQLGDRTTALRIYDELRAILAGELQIEPGPEAAALAARLRAARLPRPPMRDPFARPNMEQAPGAPLRSLDLVGRQNEILVLTARFDRARRGSTQIVMLRGEAGIGKTRLATELLAQATVAGADILVGRAFEAGGRLPYGPVVSALRERIAQENAPDDLLDDVWLAELSRLLPELRERYPHLSPAPVEPTMARTHLFEAVARLGQALARRAPLVAFLDDLQWADKATLHLLDYAARRWAESDSPILLLLAMRAEAPGEAPPEAWLAGLERDLGATTIALGPLHAADVTALVESLVRAQGGEARAETQRAVDVCGRWLFAETQGQPFYVLETLKALLDRGLVMIRQTLDGAWTVDLPSTIWAAGTTPDGLLPSGVREVLRAHLARLSPAAGALLAAGAVLGHGFSFARLWQVAELDENTALLALDEILRAQFWQQASSGDGQDHYDFRHDKIRDVAYAEAGEARRRVYHRRALALLEREAAPPAACAHHAMLAGEDGAAIRHGIAAGGTALALFAVADAITHFEHARRLLRDTAVGERMRAGPVDGEIARLYVQLGRAYELHNDLEAARAVYRELGVLAERAGRPALRAVALTRLATVTMQGNWDMEAALDLLRQALPLAEAGGDRAALAETEWTLAQVKTYGHDTKNGLAHGERALSLARRLDLPELRARCLNVIGFAALLLGHNGRALEAAEEARVLYETTGNRVLEADAVRMLADAHFQRGEAREAIRLARRARRLAEETDNLWGRVWAAKELVAGLLDGGAYAEALAEARAALDLARTQGEPVGLVLALTIMGRAARAVYALDDADAYHREARAVNATMPIPPFTELICADLCAVAALAGDWEDAALHAREALAARDFTFHLDTGLTRWLETAALLRAGQYEATAADLARFGEQTAHCPRYRLPYLRGLALLAEARGDSPRAGALLSEAASLATSLDLPGEAWQIDAALAMLYAGSGAHDEAAQWAARAETQRQSLAATLTDPTLRDRFLRATAMMKALPSVNPSVRD